MAKVTQEHFDSRREDILVAATTVFSQKGSAAATMQDVAREVGLSVGALYRYFPGKDELVAAVFEGIGERTRQLFSREALGDDSVAGMLSQAGSILEERLMQQLTREETILVLEAILAYSRSRPGTSTSSRQLQDQYIVLTEELFKEAQKQGVLDRAVDAKGLATLFVSLMVGIHVMRLEFGDALELRPLMSAVDEMLLRMAPVGARMDQKAF